MRVLSRLFRRPFLKLLAAAHAAGRLAFFGDHAALANAAALTAFVRPLRKAEWGVYAKNPFGGPQAALSYLAHYTHRVAIANSRLISADATGVTFKWKDYRIVGPGRYKTMTLPTHEFIRRFLIHVLPKGLHRIRHYGLFANGKKTRRQYRSCSPTARRAAKPRAPSQSGGRIRSASRSTNTVSMLRRSHDHRRDLCARLSAQARSGNDRDRYRVMPSPLIDRPRTHRSRQALGRQCQHSCWVVNFARSLTATSLLNVTSAHTPVKKAPTPLQSKLIKSAVATKTL